MQAVHITRFLKSTLFSSTNKIDCHDIVELLLKVALNTITPATNQSNKNTMCVI
jgi:hypothetical protein